MDVKDAEHQLEKMLESLTPGSILHVLAEVFRKAGNEADDELRIQQFKLVEYTLIVVGIGIDAACPQ